jgi:hypothetical protein
MKSKSILGLSLCLSIASSLSISRPAQAGAAADGTSGHLQLEGGLAIDNIPVASFTGTGSTQSSCDERYKAWHDSTTDLIVKKLRGVIVSEENCPAKCVIQHGLSPMPFYGSFCRIFFYPGAQ